MERKTKQYGRRAYDMVYEKWKTVSPSMVRFCGVYGNVMRRAQESGAEDEDYFERGSKRHKSSGFGSFNTESGEASINLNTNVDDNDEDEVDGNRDDSLRERTTRFRAIKIREVKCCERELATQEYRQRQEDIRFYLQPYDHLTVKQQMAMEEVRAEIKAKYNFSY
ncbi:hypothetical protein Tco_1286895 [Tanacetum coccineum]